MSKVTDNYEALAAAVGLRYDGANNTIYGQKDGYDLIVYAADSRYPYMLTIHTAAKSPTGAALTKQEKKEFAKSVKSVAALRQEGNQILVSHKAVNKQEKLKESMKESISSLLSFLKSKGYSPCCSVCSRSEEVASFRFGGTYTHLCPDCEEKMRGNMLSLTQEMQAKKEYRRRDCGRPAWLPGGRTVHHSAEPAGICGGVVRRGDGNRSTEGL